MLIVTEYAALKKATKSVKQFGSKSVGPDLVPNYLKIIWGRQKWLLEEKE